MKKYLMIALLAFISFGVVAQNESREKRNKEREKRCQNAEESI